MLEIRMKLLAAVVLAGSICTAFSQTSLPPGGFPGPVGNGPPPPLSLRCFVSGNAAAPDDYMKVCITAGGNVAWFESPLGKVQIDAPREGYAVCSGDRQEMTHGWDAGTGLSYFLPATVTNPNGPNTFPLVVTRQTVDGKIELKQSFTLVPADRELQLVMEVKNVSAAPLPRVLFARYFNPAIDGSAKDDLYGARGDSVYAVNGSANPGLNDGLMLSQTPSPGMGILTKDGRSTIAMLEDYIGWAPPDTGFSAARCLNYVYPAQTQQDLVGRLVTLMGDIPPGQTRSVTYRYRRF